MFCLSVVISYFNALRSRLGPYKANAPLVVDADAVLTCPITGQCFEAIARRRFQVTKLRGIVQHLELSLRYALDVSEPPGASTFEKRFGVGAPE
jgi:hypothetical protein